MNKGERERETPNYTAQTEGYQRGGRWENEIGDGVKDCTCDEHQVFYLSVEYYVAHPTNITLIYLYTDVYNIYIYMHIYCTLYI